MPDQHRFIKTSDGVRLAVHLWAPQQTPIAQVILIHGLGEHCRRYEHVAQAFTSAGFSLQGLDLRGHGYSSGPRGHTPSYSALMQDIDELVQHTRLNSPLPLYLYGQSLGGNLIINYILRFRPGVTGAIATSPLLLPANTLPKWKISVANLLAKITPAITMSNGINARDLSQDSSVVEKYRRDPLVHNRVSAGLRIGMLKAGQWALEHAEELAIPLLLSHGQADRITSAQASQLFAEKAGAICTCKLWPECFHELHNENQCKQIIDYMIQWMTAKIH